MAAMLSFPKTISLAIVEVAMADMGGLDFANQLAIEHPTASVLYISDLDNSVVVKSMTLRAPEHMLRKPFTAEQLLRRVRRIVP
jgi:DNA-binding response OmpR family regulator